MATPADGPDQAAERARGGRQQQQQQQSSSWHADQRACAAALCCTEHTGGVGASSDVADVLPTGVCAAAPRVCSGAQPPAAVVHGVNYRLLHACSWRRLAPQLVALQLVPMSVVVNCVVCQLWPFCSAQLLRAGAESALASYAALPVCLSSSACAAWFWALMQANSCVAYAWHTVSAHTASVRTSWFVPASRALCLPCCEPSILQARSVFAALASCRAHICAGKTDHQCTLCGHARLHQDRKCDPSLVNNGAGIAVEKVFAEDYSHGHSVLCHSVYTSNAV